MKSLGKTIHGVGTARGKSRSGRLQGAATDKASVETLSDAPPVVDAGRKRYRWAIVLGQYALAAVLTILLVTKLLFLLRIDPRIPLSYTGDSVLVQTWCKAVVDHGWYLNNPNLGAPYGQSLQDYPLADTLNFLILKVFGLLSHDAQVALHALTLWTYVGTTLSALLVLRHFRIAYPPALACALLYSMLPYHFARVDCGHQLLACYYIVPLSILLALWLYFDQLPWPFRRDNRLSENRRGLAHFAVPWEQNVPVPLSADGFRTGSNSADAAEGVDGEAASAARSSTMRWCLALVVCLLQGSAGIYYAFFAEYFLMVGGLAASLQRRKWQPLLAAGVLMTATLVAVLANLAPSFIYWREHGTNPLVAARPLTDSEVYAFKLTSMLLPIPSHRIPPLDDLRRSYDEETITPTENTWSAQGLVANAGFLVLLSLLIYRKPVSRLLEGLSILNIFGILLGTTGGLGMVFSLIVIPQIRSQNRISVFLSFYSLACVALLLHMFWQRMATTRRGLHMANGALIILVLAALWEQHPSQCRPDYIGIKRRWSQDARFVARIESAVPPKAMIFQLPYMAYPESPRVAWLDSYQTLRFYLHSDTLRWSAGAMRGREGDRWQQQIASLPLPDQLKAITAAGFAGIQINRLGYADHGEEIEEQLRDLLGVESIGDNDTDCFFPLPAAAAHN
jgi:phosphoglycerol transferase